MDLNRYVDEIIGVVDLCCDERSVAFISADADVCTGESLLN